MSAPARGDEERLAHAIPHAWRRFMRSGQYTRTRASVLGDGSEVPVDLEARVEFIDGRRLAIDLRLAGPSTELSSEGSPVSTLTARERTVISLIATGRETPEIAAAMHVSPATVRTHVRNAMAKVGAHTRAQLVAIAIAGQEPDEPGDSQDGIAGRAA